MELSYASRDRERDRGEVYIAGSNAVRIPGYPDEWAKQVPRPDGQKEPRPDTYYGPEWVRNERVRQLKIEADLLYQFAVLVASKTSHNVNTYWRGGTGGQAMLDMMIANVVTDMTPATSTGPVDASKLAETQKNVLEQHFQAIQPQELSSAAQGRFGPSREDVLGRPEQQQEWERLIREADGRRLNTTSLAGSKAGTVPPAPPAGSRVVNTGMPSTFSAPAPPPGPLASGLSSSSASADQMRARPVGSVRINDPGAQPRAEEDARAVPDKQVFVMKDDSGKIVYGVTDKWIMLLRLLLRGATATDLKAWALLYDVPEDGLKERLRRGDSATYEQYLADLTKVRSLLRRGEGSADWVRAPQHTGWIFFTEQFTGAVAAAASEVRNLCSKAWVVDLDLMTHDEVRDYFATLVANKMLKSKVTAFGRYGGTSSMQSAHTREHAGLIQLFKRLVRKSDGMLGIAGQIDTSGDAQRVETGRQRRELMSEQARYYSDVYRY